MRARAMTRRNGRYARRFLNLKSILLQRDTRARNYPRGSAIERAIGNCGVLLAEKSVQILLVYFARGCVVVGNRANRAGNSSRFRTFETKGERSERRWNRIRGVCCLPAGYVTLDVEMRENQYEAQSLRP